MMCGLVGWRALWLILVTKFYQPFANLESRKKHLE